MIKHSPFYDHKLRLDDILNMDHKCYFNPKYSERHESAYEGYSIRVCVDTGTAYEFAMSDSGWKYVSDCYITDECVEMPMEMAMSLVEKNAKAIEEELRKPRDMKKCALDFFYHWYSAPGTNTEQGFEEWYNDNY